MLSVPLMSYYVPHSSSARCTCWPLAPWTGSRNEEHPLLGGRSQLYIAELTSMHSQVWDQTPGQELNCPLPMFTKVRSGDIHWLSSSTWLCVPQRKALTADCGYASNSNWEYLHFLRVSRWGLGQTIPNRHSSAGELNHSTWQRWRNMEGVTGTNSLNILNLSALLLNLSAGHGLAVTNTMSTGWFKIAFYTSTS